MKINVNQIQTIPPHLQNGKFGFCVHGQPNNLIQTWIDYWKLETQNSSPFTNIYPNHQNFSEYFEEPPKFNYLDAFSPNLNKHLHLGHLSNLVLAKAVKALNLSEKVISIYGDTLVGEVSKEEAYQTLKELQTKYNNLPDQEFMASEMKLADPNYFLQPGSREYEGTQVFEINENQYVVGIKSDGSTSYFYQDVALADHLGAHGLYLTGSEQKEHFQMLEEIFPLQHIGLGLVLLNGKKMSSSTGNVIYLSEIEELVCKKFTDEKLIYNIVAGQILKTKLTATKNITKKNIGDIKTSLGLYLSYTNARLKSAGCENQGGSDFIDPNLEFAHLKAQVNIEPQFLFTSLVNKAKQINKLYETHHIQGNEENKQMFSLLMTDLEWGLTNLGMFPITKV
jgi:hypothetical protein